MKRHYNKSLFLLLIAVMLSVTSCNSEQTISIEKPESSVLPAMESSDDAEKNLDNANENSQNAEKNSDNADSENSTQSQSPDYSDTIQGQNIKIEYKEDELEENWQTLQYETITLKNNSIDYSGSKATVNGTTLTISKGGNYVISGKLSDGQIIIDAADSDNIRLIFNGIDISSSTSAPVYVKNANRTIITLADGTTNIVSDTDKYEYEDETATEPNSTIFSKDDLSINGTGSLTVNANFNNGISSKDDLRIINGNITITAADDGMLGKNECVIKDGTIIIKAGGDGIKATNDTDTDKGIVYIENVTLSITSTNDAIQAEKSLAIYAGDFTLVTGNGSNDDSSAKALKAGNDIYIAGGLFTIDSTDDALHSNNTITIKDGTFAINSGDDGIHSDTELTINGGQIVISNSYEGLESAKITINNGSIAIQSSDDGINVGGGADGSSVNGRPGQNNFSESGDYHLIINGGTVHVNSDGDGLDSNGDIVMTGGNVYVDGPTGNGNGSLDYGSSFEISGGILISAGSAGMAQTTSTSSSQNALFVMYSSTQTGGTSVNIKNDSGEELLSYTPTKDYQCILISSPDLIQGKTYQLYTDTTKKTDFTPAQAVTSINENGEETSIPRGFGGGGKRPFKR